jgi:AraC-like DNA-binding protein
MKCRLRRIDQWEDLAKQARFHPSRLAELCSISLRQLERYFALEFEMTPRMWLRIRRCRMALELIAEGWPNKAVAHELSFANESHLCHEFARVCGEAPQAFSSLFESETARKPDDPFTKT